MNPGTRSFGRLSRAGGWFSRDRTLALVLCVATAIVLYLCYLLIAPFLPALAWALALAVIVHPVHRWIDRWLPGRAPAAAFCVVLVAAALLVPVMFVTQQLIREADNAISIVQHQLQSGDWRSGLNKYPRLRPLASWIDTRLSSLKPQESPTYESHDSMSNPQVASQETTATAPAPPALGTVADGVETMLINFAWMGIQLLITLMALFFFFRDRHQVLEVVRSLMPLSKDETDEIFVRVDETIHATVYSSLIVAFVQGAMGGLMFWWLGLPSPLFWGVVMALLAVVPVLGTFVVWAPTAIYLALHGEWNKALTLTAWGGIAIALIDNFLNPYLVGKRLRFHTFVVFIAIAGGLATFGASGVILGPLLLALADALLHIWRCRTADGGTIESGVEPTV